MSFKVTISALGRFWAHRAAQAAHTGGLLRLWLTSAPDHKGYVPDDEVRYLPLPAYLRYGVERIVPGPAGQFLAMNLADNLYDVLASRFVDGADVLHVYNHYGLFSMRRAARHGARTLVERASAHIRTQLELLRDEFARQGLRFPQGDWPMVWKHEQEYHEADCIVCVSEYVRRTMIERGIPVDKLEVIHLGVDIDQFHPRPRQDDVFRVMFVGGLSLQKGIPYLLEGFKRARLPGSELVLVGAQFPDVDHILPRYEGLYRRIGGLPQYELPAIYASASVFVTPSVQDGFPMAVIEAMACRVPVIISENVGAPVTDGQEGYVVPIRDPDAIAERLTRLYENPALREEMAAKAEEFARRFTWDVYQRKLLDVYRRLAGAS
jgi:glycosyltransferase involved in cell wall biosynthesis